jgi:hypothetical protein
MSAPTSPQEPSDQSSQNRFVRYEERWNQSFKDCFIAVIQSENHLLRRNLLMQFMLLLIGLGILAWQQAPPLAFELAGAAFAVLLCSSIYLDHIEKRKSQTQSRPHARSKSASG